VRDAGSELAKRGELLGLDQAILRRAQGLQRLRELAGARPHFLEQPHVLDSDDSLIGKGLQSAISLSVNARTSCR
jgi:hypothetical protein